MKELTVLGCGDAFGSGGRHTTSFLVEDEKEATLIDCGASTLIRLQQIGFDFSKLRFIILSHFHGDHFGGIPFLILHYHYNLGTNIPFEIVGPPEVEEKVKNLQDAMYPETSHIIDDQSVRFSTYSSQWQKMGFYEVMAFPVSHSLPANPHGFQLRWNKKTLGFSGDTEWCEGLMKVADGAEILITECNNLSIESPGHLSLNSLLTNRKELKARRIYLSHMGNEMLSSEVQGFVKLDDGMKINLW